MPVSPFYRLSHANCRVSLKEKSWHSRMLPLRAEKISIPQKQPPLEHAVASAAPAAPSKSSLHSSHQGFRYHQVLRPRSRKLAAGSRSEIQRWLSRKFRSIDAPVDSQPNSGKYGLSATGLCRESVSL